MAVAKGRILEDKTYEYTCGKCRGAGHLIDTSGNETACNHCYALDYGRLMEAFATARGERYYALLKAILSIKGKAMCDRVREVESLKGGGHISVAEIFIICFKEFEFPENRMKPFCEWLEEARIIPIGAYDRLQNHGLKIGKTLAQVKARHWDDELPIRGITPEGGAQS